MKRGSTVAILSSTTAFAALRERRSVADRVIEKIKSFVETFIDGVD